MMTCLGFKFRVSTRLLPYSTRQKRPYIRAQQVIHVITIKEFLLS